MKPNSKRHNHVTCQCATTCIFLKCEITSIKLFFLNDRSLRYPGHVTHKQHAVIDKDIVNLPPIGSCPILYIVQDHVCTGACCFYSPKSETQHNFLQNIHLYMQLIQPYYNVHILFRNNSGLKLNKGVLRAQLSFQKDQLRY